MTKIKSILNNNFYFVCLFLSLLIVLSDCLGETFKYLMFAIVVLVYFIVCILCDSTYVISMLLALITYQGIKIELSKYEMLLINLLLMIFAATYSVKFLIDLILKKVDNVWKEMIVVALLSIMIISRCGTLSYEYFSILFKLVLLLIVSNAHNIKEKILDAFLFGVVVHIIFSIFFVVFKIGNFQDFIMFDDRFAGFTDNPNSLQMAVSISIFIILHLWFDKKINLLLFINASIIFILVGMLTYSKTFFIGLIIWLFMLFVVTIYRTNCSKRVLASSILLVSVVLLLLFNEYISHMLERFFNYNNAESVLDAITTGRWSLWKECFDEWKCSIVNILFGCGISDPIFNTYRHSTFVILLTKYGLLGCLLLLVYFGLLCKRMGGISKNLFSNFAILVGSFIISLVESIIFTSTIYILLIMLITLQCHYKKGVNHDIKDYSLHLARRERNAKNYAKMY